MAGNPYPALSVTEDWISAILALGGPIPKSFGLGELMRAFDEALAAFVAGGGGGGGGGATVKQIPFVFGSALSTGSAVFIPTAGTWQRDFWIQPTTAFNGLTPKADIAFLSGGDTFGILTAVGALPINMWEADVPLTANEFYSYNAQSASWTSALQSLGFANGPPVIRNQMQYINNSGQSLFLIVSQDGTANTPVAATLTAQSAPSGLTITATTNNFNFNGIDPAGGGGAPATEKFTFGGTFPVTFADLNALGNAMAAATGPITGAFGNTVQVSNNGTKLVLTLNPMSADAGNFPGAASNGCTIFAGNHDALATLGFTGANVFRGGVGGDPGSTAGAANLFLDIQTAAL